MIFTKRAPIRIFLLIFHLVPNHRHIGLIDRLRLRLPSPLQHIIDHLRDQRRKLQLRQRNQTTVHSKPHSYNNRFNLCTIGSIAIFIATFSFPSSITASPHSYPVLPSDYCAAESPAAAPTSGSSPPAFSPQTRPATARPNSSRSSPASAADNNATPHPRPPFSPPPARDE